MASALRFVRSGARVLVVEDDPAIREAFSELLAFEGFDVDTASDGLEALDRLRAAARPDLMLLDMMMPNLDGKGVLRAIRREPAWADLKVIVVSATEGEAPTGVVGFVKKPFEPDELVALIRRALPSPG